MVNWLERRAASRVRVDNAARRMMLRASSDDPWTSVPLFRDVRSYIQAPRHVFVSWFGDVDAQGEDLPLQPDEPTVSAFDYAGNCLWTLRGGDLPYYDSEGARMRGITYVSGESSATGMRLLLRSGPWYCEIVDVEGPKLGPVERTQLPVT